MGKGVWVMFLVSFILLLGAVLFYKLPYHHGDSWQYYALLALLPGAIGYVGLAKQVSPSLQELSF